MESLPAQERDRLAAADDWLANSSLRIGETHGSLDNLEQACFRSLDLLVYDHNGAPGLPLPTARTLAGIARRHDCAVIVTSGVALPPGLDVPAPQLTQIIKPGDVAEHADLVLALHRDDAHHRTVHRDDVGLATLRVLLNRGGPTQEFGLAFVGFRAEFTQLRSP